MNKDTPEVIASCTSDGKSHTLVPCRRSDLSFLPSRHGRLTGWEGRAGRGGEGKRLGYRTLLSRTPLLKQTSPCEARAASGAPSSLLSSGGPWASPGLSPCGLSSRFSCPALSFLPPSAPLRRPGSSACLPRLASSVCLSLLGRGCASGARSGFLSSSSSCRSASSSCFSLLVSCACFSY